MSSKLSSPVIEEAREFWASIAKQYGWYTEPFYVQVWLTPEGTAYDSVSYTGMVRDEIIQLTAKDIEELESDE